MTMTQRLATGRVASIARFDRPPGSKRVFRECLTLRRAAVPIPPDLRRVVRQVLEDPRYRENARRLQAAIQAANGLERAADIIDAALHNE
jgi:hypothetical protein